MYIFMILKYICITKNDLPLPRIFGLIIFECRFFSTESPSFVGGSSKQETLADYASSVTLPCEAIGIPPPNITWFRNAVNVLTLQPKDR